MDTLTALPDCDTRHTHNLGLAPIVHGLAQRASNECGGRAFVQWIACELLGADIRPYRHLCDRSIVTMDALEQLTATGFLRRDGTPCKIKDAAGANQVYLIEHATTPIPAHEPHDLPAAHRFVLDDFHKPNEVGGPKAHDRITVWALLGPHCCGRARVNEAYKRISERILKDLEKRNLVHRSNGWYYAT